MNVQPSKLLVVLATRAQLPEWLQQYLLTYHIVMKDNICWKKFSDAQWSWNSFQQILWNYNVHFIRALCIGFQEVRTKGKEKYKKELFITTLEKIIQSFNFDKNRVYCLK